MTTVAIPNWLLNISNDFAFEAKASRLKAIRDFTQILKRFAIGKSGSLTQKRQIQRDDLAHKAFGDFIKQSLSKPIDKLEKGDMASSFLELIDFFNSVPMEAKVETSQALEETEFKETPLPPEPLTQLSRVVPPFPGQCVFTREIISVLEVLATNKSASELQVSLGESAITENPSKPLRPRLFHAPTLGDGLPQTAETADPKTYSPKTKRTPKGQARLTVSLPINVKKKLMDVAEARGTVPTKLIVEWIKNL